MIKALIEHDKKIKNTLDQINKCVDKNSWNLVNDLTKHLLKLLKDRNTYVRYMKQERAKYGTN